MSAIYTATAVTAPWIGRVSDVFGRKYFLIFGNILGCIGCIVSATAHNISVLIVGAVFIGIGAAMNLLAWAAVGEIVPKSIDRSLWGCMKSSLLRRVSSEHSSVSCIAPKPSQFAED